MNSSKKIGFLSLLVMGIVAFWLIPGINKAKETKYVRYYENVDEPVKKPQTVESLSQSDTTARKKKRKQYKREIIEPSKTKKVTAKMFSRAGQFELLERDSSLELVESNDTLVVIQ
jgi:hypothetical protein